MITKTSYCLALVVFASASCIIQPSWEGNQVLPSGPWSSNGVSPDACAPQDISSGQWSSIGVSPDACSPQDISSGQWSSISSDSCSLQNIPSASIAPSQIQQETIAAPRVPTRIISNQCQCVKTVIRPKLVTRVSVVPTERRQVQTSIKPVVQRVQYNYCPPLNTGPSVSTNAIWDNSQVQSACDYPQISGDVVSPQSLNYDQSLSYGQNVIDQSPSVLNCANSLPQAEINIARPSPPSRVVSNSCKCVKIVLRPKLVSRVVVVPTERRTVQTFTKPVVQKVQYNFSPALSTGPTPQINIQQVSSVPTFNSLNSASLGCIAQPLSCGSDLAIGNYNNYPEINSGSCVSPDNTCGAQLDGNNYGLENISQLSSCS